MCPQERARGLVECDQPFSAVQRACLRILDPIQNAHSPVGDRGSRIA